MKLTLCVPLIWMLFSSAEALKCVQEYHWSTLQILKDPEPCNSTDVHCATVSYLDSKIIGEELYLIRRTCVPSSLCNQGDQLISFSYDDTGRSVFLHCCSTDGCNDKSIPRLAADEPKPNGLQCDTCSLSDLSCNKKKQCVGNEDRCIAVNVNEYDETHPLHGCASANLCEGDTELKLKLLFGRSVNIDHVDFSAPKCCETSLCNSAPSDKLSVISLLLALVALSVC
ncbi:phospholipase A2 inhibitor gamma subunit B-like [Halichoeres trimaculatus]|uniref:phospholipase A2 inhibitor gamma subunit B-like n=1 Tax=Halichoeres trimaculatus TaxID=147232 RepID=UPI003D9DFA2D